MPDSTHAPPVGAPLPPGMAQHTTALLRGSLAAHVLVQFFRDVVWVSVTTNGRPGTISLSDGPVGGGGGGGGDASFIPELEPEGDASTAPPRACEMNVLLGQRDDPLINIASGAIAARLAQHGVRQQVLVSLSLGRVGEGVALEDRRALLDGIVDAVMCAAGRAWPILFAPPAPGP